MIYLWIYEITYGVLECAHERDHEYVVISNKRESKTCLGEGRL